jgi:hypothetical protein
MPPTSPAHLDADDAAIPLVVDLDGMIKTDLL